MTPAFEQGKPRIVSLDFFKDVRGENNVQGLPSDPPPPSFQEGDEITEITSLELERPITEEIKGQERQLIRRERDPGDRRDTAGQIEPQGIRQTDHTQITSSCEEGGRGTHPTLGLDGEVDMQGEGNKGAEYPPLPSLENTGEPTQPTLPQPSDVVPAYSPENEIDMQEGKLNLRKTAIIKNGGKGRGSRRDCKMNQLNQQHLPPQVQGQYIIRRTRYICMRGLEE